MYAIIQTGGKQYKVSKGMVLDIEKLEVAENTTYLFKDVLLVSKNENETLIGQPLVAGVEVQAKVLKQAKDKKVIVFKYKRKTGYRRKNGHRQPFTQIQIDDIIFAGETLNIDNNASAMVIEEKEKFTSDLNS